MMKCPRCGFTQPKDQYCAQCGVDIYAYKPPAKPISQKLLESPVAQLTVVALIIFAVASVLMKKEDRSLRDRVNYLKGNLQISSQKKTLSTIDNENPSSDGTSSTTSASPSTPLSSSQNTGLAADSATSASAASATTATSDRARSNERADSAAVSRSTYELKVSYYEVSTRVRDLLIEESRHTGQFNNYGDYMAGMLTQFHRRLGSFGKESVFLHSQQKTIENGKATSWFTGLQSANTEAHVGINNSVELSEFEPGQFKLNFEVLKSWKDNSDPNSSLTKTSYPAQAEMPRSGATFISNVLTATSPLENEDYISSVPPFGVLKSPNFRQGITHFIIVIELASK